MIDLTTLKKHIGDKPVAVFGLGISGLAAVESFVKNDIDCHAWDDNETNRLKAEEIGAKLVPLQEEDLGGYAFLVLSPGIPLYFPEPHPVVEKAHEAGIEIIGDIEILQRSGHGRNIIAVTGTNGKSTTTALIGHILKENNVPCVVGGNIGVPALSLTPPKNKDGWIVLETSSYQLDLCQTFRPDIGILLNLSADHIDRHGTIENYANAKMRIFQNGCNSAVVGIDDKISKEIAEKLDDESSGVGQIIRISVQTDITKGVYQADGILHDAAFEEEDTQIGKLSSFRNLPGMHNRQNILAAYAAARTVGIEPEDILQAIETFEGLPHRLYLVKVINGIAYVNDSKATNIDAARRALSAYKKIYWILGGRPKSDGLEGAEEFLERVRHAFLIGEASEEFASWLEKRGVSYTMCGTLDKAVSEAHDTAQSERGEPGGAGTVLLAPACASFDQYGSFEERGNHFVDLVQGLPTAEGQV